MELRKGSQQMERAKGDKNGKGKKKNNKKYQKMKNKIKENKEKQEFFNSQDQIVYTQRIQIHVVQNI